MPDSLWPHELQHARLPWCWERLRAGVEGDDRGWDGWMASLIQWTWVWVESGSWWWTGRPGVLQFMGSQRVRHDWATEMNWSFPVLNYLPEFAQTHIHWVTDAIQDLILYCPLLLLPVVFPSIRVFSRQLALCIRWPKYWSFEFFGFISIYPLNKLVKNSRAMRETWVWSLGWKDPLEKGKATNSRILAWRIPWTV